MYREATNRDGEFYKRMCSRGQAGYVARHMYEACNRKQKDALEAIWGDREPKLHKIPFNRLDRFIGTLLVTSQLDLPPPVEVLLPADDSLTQ